MEPLLNPNYPWFKWEGPLTEGNPLVGTSLLLSFHFTDIFNKDTSLKPTVTKLISQFGPSLRFIHINFLSPKPSPEGIFKLICFCIESSPKLAAIRARGHLGKNKLSGMFMDIKDIYKLPEHRNLEWVELFKEDGEGEKENLSYSDFLLGRYSNQLSKVSVLRWKSMYSGFPWGSLTSLMIDKIESEGMLISLRKMTCPKLRKLSIGLRISSLSCQLRNVLEFIKGCDQLTVLRLSFIQFNPQITTAKVNSLPKNLHPSSKLRRLEMGYSPGISFAFLRHHFPSLQVLHLWESSELWRAGKVEEPEVVEVHELLKSNSGRESNIWTILPFLKEISFKDINGQVKKWSWSDNK